MTFTPPKLTAAQKAVLAKKVVDCLNSAFREDPAAMYLLSTHRTQCNEALAEHPLIEVDQPPVLHQTYLYSVGMLGVISGIMRAMDLPPIGAKWGEDRDQDDRRKFKGFALVQKPTEASSFFENRKETQPPTDLRPNYPPPESED